MPNSKGQSPTTCQTLCRESLILGYTDAGYILTPLKGKIPLVKDWGKTEYDPFLSPDEIKGNYGVVLQDDDIIVDVDPRNFPAGENSLTRLINDLGADKSEWSTFTVRTGGGGIHMYFKKPADFKIKGSLKEYKGIEFKTKGQQIVGAGSIHPETQKPYTIKCSPFAPKNAPQVLLDLIERPEFEITQENKIAVYTDSEQNILRYIKFLQSCPPAIEGEGGDVLTFKTACRGRDFALSPNKTFELMAEHFNPRCMPVWDIEDLKKKVDNAYSYNYDVVGKNTAEKDFEKVLTLEERIAGEHEEELKWDVGAKNRLMPTIRNTVNYLLCKEYPFLGIIKLNEFTDIMEFVKPSPWHNGKKLGIITDEDELQLKYWLSRVRGFNVPTQLCHEAFVIAAEKFRYHPIKDYLNSLKWDNKPRLDRWLSTYAGCEDNERTEAIARKVLVAAVARIYKPGCKFDNMLILEGEQGIGKSTLVAVLGGEWYSDISITENDKDTVAAMQGHWIIEVSEMVCTKKVDAAKLKSFISKQSDRVRLAYRRNVRDYKRQSIFIGTTNETRGYLSSDSEQRRFWPVYCSKIDIDGLKADRDQLWAEAVVRYREGEPLHLDLKLEKQMRMEAQKRSYVDPWTEPIRKWLDKKRAEKDKNYVIITPIEIFEECLGISISNVDRIKFTRVSNVMRINLNCKKGKFRNETGRVVNGYRIKTLEQEKRETKEYLKELGLE